MPLPGPPARTHVALLTVGGALALALLLALQYLYAGQRIGLLTLLLADIVLIAAAATAIGRALSTRTRAALQAAEERSHYLIEHDPLTGLANRAAFNTLLERKLRRALAGSPPICLIYLNLDDFKPINDAHGHAAGDQALVRVADSLRRLAGPQAEIARVGGDEFSVLVDCNDGSTDAARQLSERFLQAISSIRAEDAGIVSSLSASIGIACVPVDARDIREVMQCADVALQQAKRAGKGHVVAYTEDLGHTRRARLRLEQELRRAIEQDQVSVEYQPVFDSSGRVCSVEALSRWVHDLHGEIGAQDFIRAAEESGQIVELGLALMARVREDIDAWKAAGLQPVPVAINLSSRQLRREDERTRFLRQLSQLRLGTDEIEFELTESFVFEDLQLADSILKQLQRRGYALAIDDFGTGYSSLAYLRRIRCRKLKIDRMFIHDIHRDPENALMVESIIRVAHALGIVVVAEGVEQGADYEQLLAFDCDLFQGFGLARPMSAGQCAALLSAPPSLAFAGAGCARRKWPWPVGEATEMQRTVNNG